MDSNLQSYCNKVNCSNQTKRYSLRKAKALSKKLKKVNLPCSVNIHFKDSNKCAVLEFINSAHYTGAFNLFKESYPIKEITDVTGVLVEATAAIESPRVRVHWYLTQDKCMFQGPAGEVASFTEEFIHSLPNLQLFSNERNLPKQIISMDIEEDSTTNIYSISRQVSVRSSPLLKDMSNESLHKAHSLNVNVLTKKVAALSDSSSALRMPSSDHNSTCMDALIQLKNSLKADLIDIRNSINDFEDQVQRQNDKIHSLSEIIHKQEISKSKSDKKIADLQKEVKRLSLSSSEPTRPTPPTNNFESAPVAVPSDYVSPSSGSNKNKPAHKSNQHQTPIKSQVYNTVSNRYPRKSTIHQRPQVNTVSVSTAPGSQLRGNTPSPASGSSSPASGSSSPVSGSSSPYRDALVSSKGNSRPTSTSQRQHIANKISICTAIPEPIPKKQSKHLIFGDSFVRGIHAEVMSTSDGEKVEIFSWSGVRMEHLIDKISNVPLDSLVERVTIHAGINDSKFKISISSSTLTQLLKLLHAKFPNITEIAFSSIVPPAGRGVCQNYSFKNNETIESFCKSKNIIFINNYSSFLTANGAPKKRFYGDFLSITKLGFSVLAKNIKWRRNSSSVNSPSNPPPVNSIKLAKLVPSTSKPTNNSHISKELREAFMQLFTSFLDGNVI